jgi:regulator of sigma E protease
MNYVLAFILFTGLILVMGDPTPSSKPILGEVMSTSPAETAGLKAGDVIKQIDGVPISKWEDIANSVQPRADKTIEVVALRAGVEEKFTLTPRLDKTRNVGVMGVTVSTEYKPVGVFESVRAGAYQCWFWTYFTLQTIGEKIYKREKPDVAGPVGIVQMVSSAAHSGIENLIMLIGLLSVAIGLFNLFPIPVLDGGHVVLFLWEGISRRKLTEKLVARANSVGMVILFSLLIFATYSDIARIRQGRKEKAAAAEKARAEQTVPAQAPASSPAPAK